MKCILTKVDKGELQFVKADIGGALCIIDRSFMKNLESVKLNDTRGSHS